MSSNNWFYDHLGCSCSCITECSASIIAQYHSIESNVQWTNNWLKYCRTMAVIFKNELGMEFKVDKSNEIFMISYKNDAKTTSKSGFLLGLVNRFGSVNAKLSTNSRSSDPDVVDQDINSQLDSQGNKYSRFDSAYNSNNADILDLSSGFMKVRSALRSFSQYCLILEKMVEFGCVTSFVPIPMKELLEITNFIAFDFPTLRSCNKSDVKNTIGNELNVSKIDIASNYFEFLHRIVLLWIRLVSGLKQTPIALCKISDFLCRLVNHCICIVCEGFQVVNMKQTELTLDRVVQMELLKDSLVLFRVIVEYFPIVLAQKTSMKRTLAVVVTQLRFLTQLLTGNDSSVLQSSEGNNQYYFNDSLHLDFSCLLFDVIESIVLKWGVLLDSQLRSDISGTVLQCLSHMNRGVLSVKFPLSIPNDSKSGSRRGYQRDNSDIIRGSILLQHYFIKIAHADVITPRADHSLCAAEMIRLVVQACRVCEGYNGDINQELFPKRVLCCAHSARSLDSEFGVHLVTASTIRSVCTYTMMSCQSLLMPSVVPMPGNGVSISAQQYLSAHPSQHVTGKRILEGEVTTHSEVAVPRDEENINASNIDSLGDNEQSTHAPAAQKKPRMDIPVVTHQEPSIFSGLGSAATSAHTSAQYEDDDLPDIDIS